MDNYIGRNSILRNVNATFDFTYHTTGVHSGKFYCDNNSVDTIKLLMNSYYFINTITIKASIPEDNFISCQNINYPLNLIFRYSHNRENILSSPFYFNSFLSHFPILRYFNNTHKQTKFNVYLSNPLLDVNEFNLSLDKIRLNIMIQLFEVTGKERNFEMRFEND
jgi:hypothetical protein